MTGWRVPLRIARREVRRARGRSILMLVMIALPVLGVTAADVLIKTQDVSAAESIDRRLGTVAAAKVLSSGGIDASAVVPQMQSLDPQFGGSGSEGEKSVPAPTLARVLATLGGDRPGIAVIDSFPSVRTDKGSTQVSATEIDVHDPLATGLFRLARGRWPRTTDEVVVNRALADRGPGLGTQVLVGGTATRTVVGIAESTSYRNAAVLVGLPGSVPRTEDAERSWLIGGGPVTWPEVEKLNTIGALVVSRAMITHPSAQARAADLEASGVSEGPSQATITVVILVVVMALIEVVLLAGPAFAVGARRQARPLALLAACGGTPRQARRVILATGVVIGTLGAVAGVVLGIGAARVFEPVLQHFSDSWFGPFQVPWLHLVGVAVFGFVSAVTAAVVPATIASRQDVVAVLAGRRGDGRTSASSPLVGVALVAAGIVFALLGSQTVATSGTILVALSAISCLLGMLFLIPVIVVGIARLGRYLPLSLRFAVRDAARHRTRTTPAIAAVAATVAGVVVFGIGNASDEAQNREMYEPSLPLGQAAITTDAGGSTTRWNQLATAARREVPDVTVEKILGVATSGTDGYADVELDQPSGEPVYQRGIQSSLGTTVLGYDGSLPSVVTDLKGFDAARARQVLDAGGVVVFTDEGVSVPRVTVQALRETEAGDQPEQRAVTVPGVGFNVTGNAPVSGIVPRKVADRVGVQLSTVALLLHGAPISRTAETDLSEALAAAKPSGFLYVERGYEASGDVIMVQLILAGLGALLMLGGTLTATFLALSDARPDLATLSAVGAAPRTRRSVAAGYALAVGAVGAVLGVLIGLVPGIAISYPLTSDSWNPCTDAGCGKGARPLPRHPVAADRRRRVRASAPGGRGCRAVRAVAAAGGGAVELIRRGRSPARTGSARGRSRAGRCTRCRRVRPE